MAGASQRLEDGHQVTRRDAQLVESVGIRDRQAIRNFFAGRFNTFDFRQRCIDLNDPMRKLLLFARTVLKYGQIRKKGIFGVLLFDNL